MHFAQIMNWIEPKGGHLKKKKEEAIATPRLDYSIKVELSVRNLVAILSKKVGYTISLVKTVKFFKDATRTPKFMNLTIIIPISLFG